MCTDRGFKKLLLLGDKRYNIDSNVKNEYKSGFNSPAFSSQSTPWPILTDGLIMQYTSNGLNKNIYGIVVCMLSYI